MALAFHLIVVILTLLRILSRDDMKPTTRLAWFMVLITLPLIGVALYFLFGEANLGRIANAKAKAVYALIDTAKFDQKTADSKIEHVDPIYMPAFSFASSINGFPTLGGNKAELMKDAQTARDRLVKDLDEAQTSINVLYYIWLNDGTGTNVAEALIRAAKRGVTCRAMADGLGSRAMVKSKLWRDMTSAGVRTSIALPFNNIIKTILTSRLDLRNHRKITVIDGKITYCGSQNCTDPEFRVKPKFAPWIDILLRFEGPVVAQNQLLFAGDWLIHNDDSLDNFELHHEAKSHGVLAQVWGDGPTVRTSATPQMFATLISQARESLTISTPYFVPGEVVLEALCAASYRGVKVEIIFPAKNDSWVVAAASRSHYREMLEAGIVIHEFVGGLLHSKTLTIDEKVTLIGSSNMDLRSFDLNYENNILLQDQTITREVFNRQRDYITSAHPVTLKDVQRWSLPKRMWQNVVATVGPIL